MKLNYVNIKIWAIPVTMLLVGAIGFPFLPDQIAVQWGFDGEVTRMATRFTVFLMPAICMAVLLLGNIVPVIDPKKEAYEKIKKEYSIIHLAVMIVCLIAQIYMILSGLQVEIDFMNQVFIMVPGILLLVIGNYLPKIPQNYLTGVKTIWGFHNEEIWNKTQRLSGKLWFVSGLLMTLFALIPWKYTGFLNLVFIIVLVTIPHIYGIILHRKSKNIEH